MQAEALLVGSLLIVIFLQWLELRGLRNLVDKLSLRAFYIKGLHPAAENPEQFGPAAMAEANAKMQHFSEAPQPPREGITYYDEKAEFEAQAAEWERQAAEYDMRQKDERQVAMETLRELANQRAAEQGQNS